MAPQWNFSGLEPEKPRPQAAADEELDVQPAGEHWDFAGLEADADPRPAPLPQVTSVEDPEALEPVRADTAPGFLSGLAEMVISPVETARDVAVATAKGVIGLGQATIGLADVATLGRAGKFLEETTGFDPELTNEFLSGYYSESMQRQQRNLEQAEGLVDIAVAALRNPRVIGAAVAESLPIMGGGAAIARKLVLGGMGAASAGAIGEGIASGGATAETIRQQAEGRVLSPRQAALAVASGAGTSVFGMFGARLAKKLGIVDVETMLAGGLSSGPARRNLVAAIILGAVQEGFLEELPQSVQEQVAQNMALDRPWHEGVSEAAVMGSLAGVVMGGVVQAAAATVRPSEATGAPPAALPTAEPAAEVEIRPTEPTTAPLPVEPTPVQPPEPPPEVVAPGAAEPVVEATGRYAGEEMGPEARRMLGLPETLTEKPGAITSQPETLTEKPETKTVTPVRVSPAEVTGTPAVVAGVPVVETPAPADAEEHDYSSTQVNLPDAVSEDIQAVGATIDPNDLAEDGIEDESHVTVRFGLHSRPETLKRVTELLAGTGPISVTLGKTSVFTTKETGKDYEVVKVDVQSPDLERLNALLGDLPNTETHAYKPHVTIAYVKPGMGEKYAGRDDLEGTTIQLGSVSFRRKDESAVEIPLAGPAAESAEPVRRLTEPKPTKPAMPELAAPGETEAEQRARIARNRRLFARPAKPTKEELQRRHEAVRAKAEARKAAVERPRVNLQHAALRVQVIAREIARERGRRPGVLMTTTKYEELAGHLKELQRAGKLSPSLIRKAKAAYPEAGALDAAVGAPVEDLAEPEKLLSAIKYEDTTPAERANVGRMLTAIEASEFTGKQLLEVEGQGGTKEVVAGAAAHPIFAQLVGRTGKRGIPTFGWSRAKVEADLTAFLTDQKRSAVSDAAVELARRLPISHAAVTAPEHDLAPEPAVAPRERVSSTEVEEELQAMPLEELRAQVESMRNARDQLNPEGQALVDDAERILAERTAAGDATLPGTKGLAVELAAAPLPVAEAPFSLAAEPKLTEREAVAREKQAGLYPPGAPSGAATVGAFAEPAAVPRDLDRRLPLEHTSQTETPEGLKIQGIEFPELVELAEELIATPRVVRRFRGKPKLGLFKGGEGPGAFAAITLHADLFKVGQEHQLAATIAHEIGHAVDWLPTRTLKRGNILGRLQSLERFLKHTFSSRTGDLITRKDVTAELKALSQKWRPWNRDQSEPNFITYRDSSKELYADAISVLLNDPDLLERDAPVFYREFFSQLDNKPEVHTAYFDLQELLSGTRKELVARRAAGDRQMLESGDVAAMDVQRRKQQDREASQRDLWLRLRTQLVDRNTKVIDLVKAAKEAGRVINPNDDPRYLLEERNYIGGLLQGTVKRHFAPVHDALKAAGIDWHTFGRALFYDRIVAGDRSDIANPKGRSPDSAAELRAHLDTALGPEKTAVLNAQAERFRAAVKGVAEQAYQAGLYTDELHTQMQENPAYVTFQVIEHLEEGVSSRVYKQIGTLKEITNPADASILKTLVTLKAIEHQRVKTSTIGFLEEQFPDEVTPAKTIWTGKGHRPVESKDPKQKLITYFRKGRPVGVYVDPYIADALSGARIGDTFAAITILRKINSRFYRPIFTTFNLGFQSFNIARDAWRFWTNQPDMTVARMVRRYWQAVPMAKLRVWGLQAKPTEAQLRAWEDLLQAEEGKILSITFNDFMTGRRAEDTRIEEILAEHGVGGFHETPRHPALRPVMAVLDQIANLGDFIETLPKAAAMYEFKGAGEIADIPPDVRSFIRRKVGSPDFLAGGTWKPTTNEIFLFSNAITQAIRSDIEVATDPQTRSGFWFKIAISAFLPKMLMMGAMLGLGGEALRRQMEKASEYDRTNYIIIPLGEDESGNVHYFRVPMSDAGRFVGGLLWKTMRLAKGDKEVLETLAQVFDYGAGQIPSVTPSIDLVTTTAQYLSGRNPYDAFRGRYVFTRDEFAAKDWNTLKKFLGWQFQQHGGGIVWKFFPGEARPRQRTPLQKTIELPIVSNIAGRFYRITNFGELEGLRDVQSKVQRDEARGRLLQREQVNNAIRTIMEQPRARRSDRARVDLAEGITRELGYNPLQDEAAWKAKVRQVDKAIQMGVVRGRSDPVADAVMSASSNAQKVAIILRARSTVPASEFRAWMRNALKNGVVSKNVNAAVKERMAAPVGRE